MTSRPCPVCRAVAEEIGADKRFGSVTRCPQHGEVGITRTVQATRLCVEQVRWERALHRAEARAAPGRMPVIYDSDF
jgi:hypothetical protein